MTEITPEMYFHNFIAYDGDLNFFKWPFDHSGDFDGLRLRKKSEFSNFGRNAMKIVCLGPFLLLNRFW